MLSGLH